MRHLLSRIFVCIYFWNFQKGSYAKKRKKVIEGKKYITKKKATSMKKTDLIVFKDDKGIVCFSIQTESLLYIESDTNYITIFYSNQGKLEKYLMRASLKMVLEENRNDLLVRCHRSYIVNFKKIKIYKKDKDGGIIELSDDSLPSIPVSKSYIENVLSKFQFQ
jgi:DNA-binding LytR/AlgR family response regulator